MDSGGNCRAKHEPQPKAVALAIQFRVYADNNTYYVMYRFFNFEFWNSHFLVYRIFRCQWTHYTNKV